MKNPQEVLLLTIPLQNSEDSLIGRQRTRQIMGLFGFANFIQTQMTTAVSEIVRNAYQYAGGGIVRFSVGLEPARLIVQITDHGSGISHLATVLSGQYVSKTGLGLGITGAKKLVDGFTIHSTPSQGANVVLTMNLSSRTLSITEIAKIGEELVRYRPKNASEEVHQQNQDLIQALDLLSKARDELEQKVSERTANLTNTNALLMNEIAKRKEIEMSLRETTDQLHLALDSACASTWAWSLKENKVFFSKETERLFGVPSASFPPAYEDLISLIHCEDSARFKEAVDDTIENNVPLECSFRTQWPDGTIRYLMSRARLHHDKEGSPTRVIGVNLDITEQKKTEEHLQQYRTKLTEAARTSSLGEMASAIAHEINQPLTAVAAYARGCVRRIENNNELTPEITQVIKEIASQAERAGEIIHRIKSFAKKGQLFFEGLELNQLIKEALRLLQPELEKFKMQVTYQPLSKAIYVSVDKIQIQQVLLNLLRNGMESMQEAGKGESTLTIEAKVTPQSAFIYIKDKGTGLAADVADKIFEAYVTTKKEGMGMGLAICRSVIEAHHGELTATNLSEGGCCFSFNLPMEQSEDTH